MHTFKLPLYITVEDLESLPEDFRYELHEGVLHIMPPPIQWHSWVARRLANTLERAGMATGTEVGVKFSDNDERTPDVAVFKDEPNLKRAIFSPSDFLLLIEVVSKSSEAQDRILKPLHYAKAGIPEYWRVEEDPDSDRDALVHQYKLSAEGKYDKTAVVKLTELEAGLTPP
ncbi:MAG TPA: Uma2 family endonuclease [Candidatus Limnocylindrales bacterium]